MKGGLGNMPLTLFVLVAGVILYLHVRRASLGIDTHPGEGKSVTVKPKAPSVFIGPRPSAVVNQRQPGQDIDPYANPFKQFMQWWLKSGTVGAAMSPSATTESR